LRNPALKQTARNVLTHFSHLKLITNSVNPTWLTSCSSCSCAKHYDKKETSCKTSV